MVRDNEETIGGLRLKTMNRIPERILRIRLNTTIINTEAPVTTIGLRRISLLSRETWGLKSSSTGWWKLSDLWRICRSLRRKSLRWWLFVWNLQLLFGGINCRKLVRDEERIGFKPRGRWNSLWWIGFYPLNMSKFYIACIWDAHRTTD